MTISRGTLPFLAGLLVLSATSPGAAQHEDEGYPKHLPHDRVEIIFHHMRASSGLQALLAQLRALAHTRQLDAIAEQVADDFFLERDFDPTPDPRLSGVERFTTKLRIDPQRTQKDEIDDGWARLGRLLGEVEFGPAAERDGVICTSPLADFKDEERAGEVFEALMADYLFDTMYAEGVTPVYADVEGQSPVIGRIDSEAVLVIGRVYADADVPIHYEVLLPDGRPGYVQAGALGSFMAGRLCFAPEATGQWKIAGYIGGRGI